MRADASALNELVKLGYRSTPVTLFDGEAVVGFDSARFEEMLAE